MAGAISPVIRWQITQDGVPVPGALLYTFLSATSTPWPVYNNSDLAIGHAHTNPVIASSDGTFPVIYLDNVAYRFFVTDADGGVVFPAQDDIPIASLSTVNTDLTGTAGENLSAGNIAYLSDGSGGGIAGRWYKADADNTYSSTLPMLAGVPSAITSGATGTFRLAGTLTTSGLAAGTTYYVSATAGAVTASAPPNARVVGQALSATVLLIDPNPRPVTAPASSGMNALSSLLTGLFCDLTLATPTPVDGSYITTSAATIYTVPSSTIALVSKITVFNADTVSNDAQIGLVEFGGSLGVSNKVTVATVAAGATLVLDGPWLLDTGDFIRCVSASATGTDMSIRVDLAELPAQLSGVTLLFNDGSALTNAYATYFTAAARTILFVSTICNTDTSARVVSLQLIPSAGSAANSKQILGSNVTAGQTVIVGGPYVLETGDFIQAKAATGAVVSLRLTAFQLS